MEPSQARPARGLWRDAWRRLKQNKAALTGAAYVLIMLVIAIVAPLLAPYNPDYIPPTAAFHAMSTARWAFT